MENYGLAIADADLIIKLNAQFVKAYYRKGTAHLFLGKFDEAKDDFTAVFICRWVF
jgi:serine/threonine-protein phosphatase 5